MRYDGMEDAEALAKGRMEQVKGFLVAQGVDPDAMEVARAAAIYDTRFTPVRPDEIGDLSYEISVLTPPEPTTPDKVVVGRDGLIMSRGGKSGLLLPQVPIEWQWNRDEFLAHTCRKAGLPLDCWRDPETKIESFRAIVWGEDDLDN